MAEASPPPDSLVGLLRHHRRQAGLTQEDLAERAGLSAKAISALERGERRPRARTLLSLARALDLSAEDRERLLRGAIPARRDLSRHRLPAPLSAMIGREREVAAAVRHLRQPDQRLLSITGPAGVGKTRLALAVADLLLNDFPGGVCFVDLSPLRDVQLIAPSIRQSLDLSAVASQAPLETIAKHLRMRRALLLLDNFEHLLDGAALVAELLVRCRLLRCLVTSRAPLRIRGELELELRPLALPDPERTYSAAELADVPAAALFARRAASSSSGFQLTAENAKTIGEICRRLDGLPLAIELAAASTRLLTPPALLDRLQRRLPVLVDGARDLPVRQRTMRSALRWSYDLLGAGERRLFRRLAVFAGGAGLEAVQAVCGDDCGNDLWALMRLVDASLVQRDPMAPERVFVLETVREYADELLAASRDGPALARAHAAHYARLVARAEAELTGDDQATWLTRLAREHDNLRVALRWARDGGDPALGLQMAGRLWRFWDVRGHFHEGLGWLEAMLAAAPRAEVPVQVLAHNGAGNLARRMAEYDRARAHYEAAAALSRATGDAQGEGGALNNLGNLALLQGNLEDAIAFHSASLALRRRLGDPRSVGVALNNLAIAAYQAGDHERALALQEEALAIRRARGDQRGVAYALVNMGELARVMGDLTTARACLEECMALSRDLGDRTLLAGAIGNLGGVARSTGDSGLARARYLACLDMYIELGDLRYAPSFVDGLAATAWMDGHPERAARLYAASVRLRKAIGTPRPPNDRKEHEPIERAVRVALVSAASNAAVSAGHEEEAVLEALFAQVRQQSRRDGKHHHA